MNMTSRIGWNSIEKVTASDLISDRRLAPSKNISKRNVVDLHDPLFPRPAYRTGALTLMRRVIKNHPCITHLPPVCSQKPPTRFFPVAPFFPAGSRPPKRPGNTCVLAIIVECESACVSGPVKSVTSTERPSR